MSQDYKVNVADDTHLDFAEEICKEMEESAKARGTGIAKRSPAYIEKKMDEGKAVIVAHCKDDEQAMAARTILMAEGASSIQAA